MTSAAAPDLRFPVGRLQRATTLTPEARRAAIDAIAAAPAQLRKAVAGLTDAQLDTPYRPEGWTVRQLIHHVADSHMHALLRTRYAFAEPGTTITAYDEKKWAELPDMRTLSAEPSLALLDGVHARWIHLLRAAKPEDFARTVTHPENGEMTVDSILSVYSWHGRHHTAHVTALRERNGWG
jgi:uncharacterized damage-inducible protein DinB